MGNLIHLAKPEDLGDIEQAKINLREPQDLGGNKEEDSFDTVALTDEDAHHPDEATDADIQEFLQNRTDVDREGVEPFTVSEAESYIDEVQAQGGIFTNLLDWRFQLARKFASGHGPNNQYPLAQKGGLVIHYAGNAQNRSISPLARWQSYARTHVNMNWGQGWRGNGIMYHLGAGENGEKALLFDLPYARWHVGKTADNNFGIGINNPIGQGQRSTKAQIRANFELSLEWQRYRRFSRSRLIGHQESSATACPGSLMNDFVYPFRNGANFGSPPPPPIKEPESPHHPERKIDLERVNFLSSGEKDNLVSASAAQALNRIARRRGMGDQFARRIVHPPSIRYAARVARESQTDYLVMVVCGGPAKKELNPKEKEALEKYPTSGNLLEAVGTNYEDTKRKTLWRLMRISETMGFGQQEKDMVAGYFKVRVGLK